MKKIFLLLIAATIVCMPMAAQKRTYHKARTTQRSRITQKKKTTTTTKPVVINDPMVVDGHIAFLGIPLSLGKKGIEQQLPSKGLTGYKDEHTIAGISFKGIVFGEKVDLAVDDHDDGNICVNWRELKQYREGAVKARTKALANAIVKNTNGKIKSQNYYGDQGHYLIQAGDGYIDVSYYNEDEVNFESDFYNIVIQVSNYEP